MSQPPPGDPGTPQPWQPPPHQAGAPSPWEQRLPGLEPGPVPPGQGPPAGAAAAGGDLPPVAPPPTAGPPPRRRRGPLLAALALGIAVLLCAGGGLGAYLWLRDTDGPGADDPAAAVEEFLNTVYVERDPARAAALVCARARDEADLAEKIDEIDAYHDTHLRPRFTWTSELVEETDEQARVAVTVTMTTADEKVAEQQLMVTVLHTTGWWVCGVDTDTDSG